MKALLIVLSAGLLLVSCVPSTPQTRIQQAPRKFDALSEKHRDMVKKGEIARGMSPDAVYLAWGGPTRIFQGSKNGVSSERWDYAGSRPVYSTGFYGSYAYGSRRHHGYSMYGIGVGPDVAYIPYRVASVWFLNNRVDSWERVR